MDGKLDCGGCGAWYRIEDGILDLLELRLQDFERRTAFARRHGLTPGEAPERRTHGGHDHEHKSSQQAFFSEVEAYERDVVQSSFYQALDALTVEKWIERLPAGSAVLDIGAGTCRTTLPAAARGHRVIAIDLTEPLLKKGRDKVRAAGMEPRVEFVLADAEALPLGNGVLDGAMCHGVLHHMNAPARAIAEAGRVLKPGGRWYSLDPNRSPARWIFDLSMRVRTLWHEEAADHPLQDGAKLAAWCAAAGIDAKIRYTCYVLPHALTPLPARIGRAVLQSTDALFSHIPALASLGGVVYADGIKASREGVRSPEGRWSREIGRS